MKHRLLHQAALGLSMCLATLNLAAQNPPAPLTPLPAQPKWETLASAGLTLTKGNSDTMLANLGLIANRKWEQNELALTTSLSYGENSGVKNVDSANGSAQYNRLFSDRFYGGLKLMVTEDAIADLDYRVSISPLAGYYLMKEAATRLSLEVGPSYIIERLGGVSKGYGGLRVGERFEHKFNDRAKMWQAADLTSQVDRFSKYLATCELGIDSLITKQVSLRAVLQDNYDSKPAPGRKANDIRLITGLGYKF